MLFLINFGLCSHKAVINYTHVCIHPVVLKAKAPQWLIFMEVCLRRYWDGFPLIARFGICVEDRPFKPFKLLIVVYTYMLQTLYVIKTLSLNA